MYIFLKEIEIPCAFLPRNQKGKLYLEILNASAGWFFSEYQGSFIIRQLAVVCVRHKQMEISPGTRLEA